MSKQTITTEQIREAIYGQLPPTVRAEEEPKFDRWFASVKADAWYEGWSAADDYGLADEDTDNPYRGESE